MMRTPEQQYLHELIESYIAPLRSEIKELRQQLNTKPVKNNGVLTCVIDESFLAILDAYQVECQIKYHTGTIPDAREWFAKWSDLKQTAHNL